VTDKEMIAKLRELVNLLCVAYFNQDPERIKELMAETGPWEDEE
jgi:hypothetical protein